MTSTSTAAAPRTFAGAQEILAAALPGYTRRPAQEALAAAIEDAISGSRIIEAEAGCGTGKSFAALIPAILHAVHSGQRVIIATATKALQSQYAGNDIPFLEANLGVPFRAAVIKGRSNYPCKLRISELRNATPAQQAIVAALAGWDEAGPVPDRDILPSCSDADWMALAMPASEYPGKDDCSPDGSACWADQAKMRAEAAHVVITNTAYLITDLRIREITDGTVSLLGDYGVLVADEAHNLPDVVTGALSDSIGLHALKRLASDADGFFMTYGETEAGGGGVALAASLLWEGLKLAHSQYAEKMKPRDGEPVPFRSGSIASSLLEALTGQLDGLEDELGELAWKAEAILREIPRDPESRKQRSDASRMVRRIHDWKSRISAYAMTPRTEMVKWLEEAEVTLRGRKETRLFMRSAPVSAGPFLRKNVWDVIPAVVLMSATLAPGGDFGYLERAAGLDSGEAVHFDAGSPFDFTSQARLFVPDATVPAPAGATAAAWRAYAQEATRALVGASGGGALLLYTSRSAMEAAHAALEPGFSARGLTVMKQGDMPSGQLKQAFEADVHSVLFGLRTFFEGIDVQGKSLRLVVLDKLPFPVPSDLVFQARCEAVDKMFGHRKSFGMLSIPAMSLVLTQAFGRLIRHKNDKGVVAILDSRLTTKSYGREILASLPPAPVTTSLEEAAAFLNDAR